MEGEGPFDERRGMKIDGEECLHLKDSKSNWSCNTITMLRRVRMSHPANWGQPPWTPHIDYMGEDIRGVDQL